MRRGWTIAVGGGRRALGAASLAGLFAVATAAAATERGLDGYIAEHWTTESGLPQNSVNAVAQTADGHLWIATFGGLARFDGVRFRVFDAASEPPLPSSRVNALHVDREDRLWVGTEDAGAVVFAGRAFAEPRGGPLAPGTVWAFAETADDALWIAVGETVERRRGAEIDRFGVDDGLPGRWVRALGVDPDGSLWVGTERGAARFEGGRFVAVSSDPVWSFAAAADGRWLSIGERGVSRVDAAGGELEGRLEVAADLRGARRDRAGALWLGGERLGRVPADESGCEFDDRERFGRRIRTIFEDRDGGLWIGTDAFGLMQLRPRRAQSFGRSQGLGVGRTTPGDSVLPVFEDAAGALWVGSCGGLAQFENGRFRHVAEVDEPAMRCVTALAPAADGGMWVGARGLRKHGGAPAPAKLVAEMGDRAVRAVLERPDGTIWLVTGNGVSRFADDRLAPVDGLERREGWVVRELADGRLAIGLRGAVALIADGPARLVEVHDTSARSTPVRDLWQAPDGALWAATYGAGLIRLQGLEEHSKPRITHVDTRRGLIENFVSRILDDNAGHLWLSGNRGIYRLALDELERAADGGARVVPLALGVTDGLEVAETNGGGQPAGWRRRDGTLVFPTVRGIAVVDPATARPHVGALAAVIDRLVVDGEERAPAALLHIEPDAERRLEIGFSAPTFVRPELVRFRYRLAGLEDDWRTDSGARSAHFSHLPPGLFAFEVQAAGEDGRFSPAATLAIEVAPRFVETWAFRALLAIALGAAIVLFVHLRLAGARRRERELAALVAERTGELAELNTDLERRVAAQTVEIRDTRDLAILTLARLAELRDGTTGEHLDRIARFSRRLALELVDAPGSALDLEFVDEIYRSSPLHDIGKVAIPDGILRKPGPLDADERATMRTHTSIGGDTLRAVGGEGRRRSFLDMAARIAYSHHERWDGNGYPQGLAGEAIPLEARIVALVDAYDAITSSRPYKPAHSHAEALRRIAADRGSHFDPRLVDALMRIESELDRIRREHVSAA